MSEDVEKEERATVRHVARGMPGRPLLRMRGRRRTEQETYGKRQIVQQKERQKVSGNGMYQK